MKAKYMFFLLSVIGPIVSCEKVSIEKGPVDINEERLSHDEIVLGERLENPYKTENIQAAYSALYPTKARTDIETNKLYVRFLPKNDEEFRTLEKCGLDLIDHPLDYRIEKEGDWYHDPDIAGEAITWQYAVVPKGFIFPEGIDYELVDECYVVDETTKSSDGIDWEAVEREAYRITGNESMILETKAGGSDTPAVKPAGRITVMDPMYCEGKPCGVSGVKVVVNSFVKFSSAFTDREGYYEIPKAFSSNLRYRLMFKNEKGFAIGVNLILVPASVSTLGTSGPEGVNLIVTEDSEDKLYTRCVVNNAAYDYYERCSSDDLDITPPSSGLRIWIFRSLDASSAVMMHQGAVVSLGAVTEFLGNYAFLVKYFAPDITIGAKGKDELGELYCVTAHEMAHASHFEKVGTVYWNPYIRFILESFLLNGGMTYGAVDNENSGYCEIGEMWGYYMQSKVYYDRYGGTYPSFGTSYWFYPQIFRYLEERGFQTKDIFAALDPEITTKSLLKDRLLTLYPNRKRIIEQVFDRYK